MKTVVLTGGGTAGHVIPALALIPELTKRFDRIVYIGSDGIEKRLVEEQSIPFFRVNAVSFNRSNLLKNVKIPSTLKKSVAQATSILEKQNASIVFTKGGYIGLPAAIAAAKLKIPVVAHESDTSIGLANRVAAFYGAKILTAFPELAQKNKNYQFVGFPLKENLFTGNAGRAKEILNIVDNRPIITVIGGSQGSQAMNAEVTNALSLLLKNYNVAHVLGEKNSATYSGYGYFPITYCNFMPDLYALSDIVISRAGAGAVSELAALNKCAVLIPLPKGNSRGDQVSNARYAEKYGAIVLSQDNLSPTNILNAVIAAKSSPMQPFVKNASESIAQLLAELSK